MRNHTLKLNIQMKTLILIILSLFLQSYAVSNNTNRGKGDVLFKSDMLTLHNELDTLEKNGRLLDWNTYYKNYREMITFADSSGDSLGYFRCFLVKKGIVNKNFKYSILLLAGAAGGYESHVYVVVKNKHNKFLDKQLIAQLLADCGGESCIYGTLKNDLSAELIDYSIERDCSADSVTREGINSKYQIVFDTTTKKFVRK